MSQELVIQEGKETRQIYPYTNLEWKNHVDRFKVLIPKEIIDITMGTSICVECGQVYSGYQQRCTRLRWGYKTSSYSHVEFGNKIKGQELGSGFTARTVYESKQYPCDHYTSWNLRKEWDKQFELFSTLDYLINALPIDFKPDGFNLTLDQQEKIALYQQITVLQAENQMIKTALKEVVNRLNAGGSGLLGGINLFNF